MMRAVWPLLLALVSAQDPISPVRLCANAAEGAEVEVCLDLAAEHPDQIDGINAALRAHIDRAGRDDRLLMTALLALAEDGQAVDATERLVETHDARALPALMVAAQTRSDAIVEASVRALGHFPEAHETLAMWLLDPRRPVVLRLAIVDVLGAMGGDAGADALVAARVRSRTPRVVKDAVLDSLRRHQPERYARLDSTIRRDGTGWLILGTSVAGGQAFGALGHVVNQPLAGTGIVTGVLVGGTTGWVLGRSRPIEARQAAFIATMGTLGVVSGATLGAGLSDGSDDGAWVGATVGNVVAFPLSSAFRRHRSRTVGDAVETQWLAATAGVLGATGVNFARKARWRAKVQPDESGVSWTALGTGLGIAGGGLVGAVVAPNVSLSRSDWALVGLSGGLGLGMGLMAPTPGLRRGLPVAGLTAGVLVGYGIAGAIEPGADAIAGAAMGAIYGGAIGVGAGMLVDSDAVSSGGVARGFALAGGSIGLAVGSVVATNSPGVVDPSDIVFVSLTTATAAVHSMGVYAGLAAPPRQRGWFVLAPAVVGGLAALSTPLVDIPSGYSLTAASFGAWAGYGTYGVLLATGQLRRDRFLYGLLAADVGIAVGLFAGAPPFNLPPLIVALADVGAVAGGGVAAIGVGLIGADSDQIIAASVVGAAIGLTAGTVIGVVVRSSGRNRDMALRLPSLPELRVPGEWVLTPTMVPTERSVVPGIMVVGGGF